MDRLEEIQGRVNALMPDAEWLVAKLREANSSSVMHMQFATGLVPWREVMARLDDFDIRIVTGDLNQKELRWLVARLREAKKYLEYHATGWSPCRRSRVLLA